MRLEIQKFVYLSFILVISCISNNSKQGFTFKENSEGVEIKENGQPVFFYQRKHKSLDGKYTCNNYIHPLYSLNGDTLTEEFPVDHPYHRGIFWAWHQMYVDGHSVGDGWFMSDIEQEVTDIESKKNKQNGQFKINACWKSPLYEKGIPFLAEETIITIYPRQQSYRIIDFSIALKALISGVEIGGSDDEKGYGGFCARIRMQDKLTFTSINGNIIPQRLQIATGSWMDFSGPLGKNGEINGITILCHPETPNYPASWILRNQTSMQNIVFPGINRIAVPMERPINLYYRMIIHEEDAKSINIEKIQSVYEQMSFK